MRIWRSHRWPVIASAFFWVGATAQIAEILMEGTAQSVSLLNWTLAAIVLFGYVGFYDEHMSDSARLWGMVASSVSGLLYSAVAVLALLY